MSFNSVRIHSPSGIRLTASPVEDMSWLVFGLDRRTGTYSETYMYCTHSDEVATKSGPNCGCTCRRNATRSMNIIVGHLWVTPIFQAAWACLRLLACGMFPCAPRLAPHWMMGGRFTMYETWVIPVYDDNLTLNEP